MKWFKAFKIGLTILNGLADKAKDGKVSKSDIFTIVISVANQLGYNTEDA